MRRGTKPSKAKVESSAAAPKSPESESSRVRDLEERLAEALKREAEAREQQTATSELLKVIGRSTFDLQAVFETLAENAVRLCQAGHATIFRFDGHLLRAVVTRDLTTAQREFVKRNPIAPGRESGAGRAALERRTIHIHDVQNDPDYTYGGGSWFRTLLAIPILRAGELLGTVSIQRDEVRPFTDNQIALMETFADQAAIAIENARLFNETREALEQQTATGEILRVISQSPTDVQPVFDSIAELSVRLCDAAFSAVFKVDADHLHVVARHNFSPEGLAELERLYPLPLSSELGPARCVREHTTINIADTEDNPKRSPEGLRLARSLGYRSLIMVPMLRDDLAIGLIALAHRDTGAFSGKKIALLQTFADQAVIAIENVRLFTELQQKNEALTQAHAQVTEALEQQTATSEILRVISSSPTDAQPVFDTIVRNAVRLTGALYGVVSRT